MFKQSNNIAASAPTSTPISRKSGSGRRSLNAAPNGGEQEKGWSFDSSAGEEPVGTSPLYKSYIHRLSSSSTLKDHQSFERNQSYPNPALQRGPGMEGRAKQPRLFRNKRIQDFTGFELNSVNFSRSPASVFAEPRLSENNSASKILSRNTSTDLSCMMGRRASDEVCQYKRRGSLLTSASTPMSAEPSPSTSSVLLPLSPLFVSPAVVAKNPNKAVLTVDGTTNKILMANDIACAMFSLDYRQVVGRTLESLCHDLEGEEGPMQLHKRALLSIDSSAVVAGDGQLIPFYGKIIDVVSSSGARIPVSLWVYPLKQQAHHHERWSSTQSGTRLSDSMPASMLRSSRTTAHRKDSSPLRFLVLMDPVDIIAGSCVLGPKGRIFSADSELATIFGSKCSNILGTNIKELLPGICLDDEPVRKLSEESKSLIGVSYITGRKYGAMNEEAFPIKAQLVPTRDEDDGSILKFDLHLRVIHSICGMVTVFPNGKLHSFNTVFVLKLLGYTHEELQGKSIAKIIPDFLLTPIHSEGEEEELFSDFEVSPIITESLLNEQMQSISLNANKLKEPVKKRSSTSSQSERTNISLTEGNYVGHCEHRDGAQIPITYQIRRLVLKDKDVLFCVWIAWEGDFAEPLASGSDTPLNGSPSTVEINTSHDQNRSTSLTDTEWCEMIGGEYSEKYETLQQIGKGAFGAVKLAAEKSSGLLVVTKFMRTSKILKDSFVVDAESGKKTPIEVHLLQMLSHPNIVKVLDVFVNDAFYQMVMEKHGCGMDLFDFIDRQPNVDEPLICYIFRQIVSAVAYLHALRVVHRDLKDENVIIDQHFKCKLIDFGSAAYFSPDHVFSTFCGTMEYCSPEVLLGNKYVGPEVEMWSLGILLYTLIFFENPFSSPEETIDGYYEIPFEISEGLVNLLGTLLHSNPRERATISEAEKHWWLLQKVDASAYRFGSVLPSADPHEIDPPKYKQELQIEI